MSSNATGSTHTMKMTTNIPEEITTPDSVETSLGTLRFFDGLPDKLTVEKVFDNLDFMRGVDVFLNTTGGDVHLGKHRRLEERCANLLLLLGYWYYSRYV
jgi:hypothetical protein